MKLRKTLLNILMAVCVGIFCFSGYKLFEIWQTDRQVKKETSALQEYLKPSGNPSDSSSGNGDSAQEAEDSTSKTVFSPDWAGLQAKNPNICGWIIVPGTNINYPVVQGSDNVYYLTHTALGEENYIGSVFMDYMNRRDFSSDNTLLYAHSVDIGGMFTDLRKFENLDFFDTHPFFWILTPQQNYRCYIFAFTKATPDFAVYTIDYGDYAQTVTDEIWNQATYTRDIGNLTRRPMVSLSTCNLDYGFHSDQRLVLSALLSPYDEPIYTDMVETD